MSKRLSCVPLVILLMSASLVLLVDPTAPSAILEPHISYVTYLGGANIEEVSQIACGADGSIAVVAHINSADFTTTEGVFQPSYSGGTWDVLVAKFDASGSLQFSSFLGGSDYEHVDDVEVLSDGSLVVVGFTSSSDFPVTSDALQPSLSGDTDGFIARISADGSTLQYATYLGGIHADTIRSVKIDSGGNYLIAGSTSSTGMATDGAFQMELNGSEDVFVAKVASNGSSLEMLTYLGGGRVDRVQSMTIDSSGNYVLTGKTSSLDFPTTEEAYQTSNGGVWDAYLAKVSADGTSLLFSTYLGGSSDDEGRGVAIDSQDGMILAGYTSSTDLRTERPLQPEHAGGGCDALVFKCFSNGTVEYVTYLGGSEFDISYGVAIDDLDRPVIVGRTLSDDYPTVIAPQTQRAGHLDTTITILAADGQSIEFSSYFGGSAEDSGESVVVCIDGTIILTGRTASPDLPVTTDAYQTQIGGSYDVFLLLMHTDSASAGIDPYWSQTLLMGCIAAALVFSGIAAMKKWRRG